MHLGLIGKKGTTPVETFYAGSPADVGLIKTDLLSAANRRIRNQLLESVTGNRLRIAGYTLWANQTVGMPVCRMGWNTGKKCGVIEIRNDDRPSVTPDAEHEIVGVVVYSADALYGDSGGPVFHVSQACETCETLAYIYGTHVHSDEGAWSSTKDGWYSPWDRGMSAMEAKFPGLDLAPCTTSSCGLPDPVGD